MQNWYEALNGFDVYNCIKVIFAMCFSVWICNRKHLLNMVLLFFFDCIDVLQRNIIFAIMRGNQQKVKFYSKFVNNWVRNDTTPLSAKTKLGLVIVLCSVAGIFFKTISVVYLEFFGGSDLVASVSGKNDLKCTLEVLLSRPFGFPKFFSNHLLLRMEDKKNFATAIYKEYFKHIPPKLVKMLGPVTSSLQTRHLIYVYRLHLLNTYRGWRYIRNLPSKGQRTWSNAWTAHRCNTLLKPVLIRKSRIFYGNLSNSELYTAYMAEYVNKKWILHWRKDWLEAREERLKSKKRKKFIKIDLYSMARGHILTNRKFEKLSRKQKAQHNRNHYSLGFKPGFTRTILKKLFKLKAAMLKVSKHANFIMNKGDMQHKKFTKKRKKVDLKAKKAAHIARKKKKKSIWS